MLSRYLYRSPLCSSLAILNRSSRSLMMHRLLVRMLRPGGRDHRPAAPAGAEKLLGEARIIAAAERAPRANAAQHKSAAPALFWARRHLSAMHRLESLLRQCNTRLLCQVAAVH